MKHKLVLLSILLGVILSGALVSCMPAEIPDQQGTKVITESKNLTYLRLDLDGDTKKNMSEIIEAIDYWVLTHPDLDLVTFQIMYQQHDYTTPAKVYGVLIFSKPAK